MFVDWEIILKAEDMTCTIQISVSLQILGIFLTCCLANTIRIEFDEVIKIRNGHDLHTHSET